MREGLPKKKLRHVAGNVATKVMKRMSLKPPGSLQIHLPAANGI